MEDGDTLDGLRTHIVFRDVSIELADMAKLYAHVQKLGSLGPLPSSKISMKRFDQTLDERTIHVMARRGSLRYRVEECHNLEPGESRGMASLGSKSYDSAEIETI